MFSVPPPLAIGDDSPFKQITRNLSILCQTIEVKTVNQSLNQEICWRVQIDLEWVRRDILAFLTVSIKETSTSIHSKSKLNIREKCIPKAACTKQNSNLATRTELSLNHHMSTNNKIKTKKRSEN